MFVELTSNLILKGEKEGRRGSIRLFQSKETILELRGIILEVSGISPCSKVLNYKCQMSKAWLVDMSLSKKRVVLDRYYIDSTTSSTNG
jgi:hypothetical protein